MTLADTFTAPSVDYVALLPVIIIFVAATLGVLVETVFPRPARRGAQLILTFLALVGAGGALIWYAGDRGGDGIVVGSGALAIDGPALFLQGTLIIFSLIAALFMAERGVDSQGDAFAARAAALPGSADERAFTARGWFQTEIWPLFLFSLGGMMLFTSANDLLMAFIALEVLSLPLYLLTGMARRRRLLSQEAAVKYFLLGAFASAFFIYGAAMLYGFSGSITYGDIAQAASENAGNSTLLMVGVGMTVLGLLFKVGAAPFHQWTADVYQGAPTPLTGYMASATKVAAFGALIRLLYVALGGVRWDWQPILILIAIATTALGVLLALTQRNIKRMLAFSSVAHAGFVLIGIVALNGAAISGVLFYLATYGIATLGAFAVVMLVRNANGEAHDLSAWAGLGRRSPWVAAAMTIFMLSFTGIPLTAGFIGKFVVFAPTAAAGLEWLVVFAVLFSAVSAFFYIRLIVLMYFSKPTEKTAEVVMPQAWSTIGIALTAAITVLLGVLPGPLLDLAVNAGLFIR